MRYSRTIKYRVGGRLHRMNGGNLSNIKKLEEDFAKQVTFGKSDPTEQQNSTSMDRASSTSSATIKKKFSI